MAREFKPKIENLDIYKGYKRANHSLIDATVKRLVPERFPAEAAGSVIGTVEKEREAGNQAAHDLAEKVKEHFDNQLADQTGEHHAEELELEEVEAIVRKLGADIIPE